MRFPSLWRRTAERPAAPLCLPFPATPKLRAALVGGSGRLSGAVHFPEGSWREIPSFAPQLLAGELTVLLRLADQIFQQALEIPSLDTAIFLLTPLGRTPVTAAQRDTLWRAFGVPAYELYVDESNTVLASECEAHEGWHLRHARLKFDLQTRQLVFQKHGLAAKPLETGLSADGLDSICACGDDAPLLRHVRSAAPAIQLAPKAARKSVSIKQTATGRRAATA